MSLTLLLGYFAGFLTTVSLVPQVVKMWTTKSADDFSLVMLLIWCTGISCWVVYGVLLNAVPIILWNVSTLLLAVAILIMKLKFKGRYTKELKLLLNEKSQVKDLKNWGIWNLGRWKFLSGFFDRMFFTIFLFFVRRLKRIRLLV